jgi:hypothetical protein
MTQRAPKNASSDAKTVATTRLVVTLPPAAQTAPASQPVRSSASLRDPRLDFFRGLAMFIILIAHIPGNWATLYIPARFGFSDATEIFVFCSGMASAAAFGKVFRDHGWGFGTARIAFRVWQVYWAHVGLFLAVAGSMALINASPFATFDYVGDLNLYPFFNDTQANLVGLLTLTYVPNYFDVLPMYIGILIMLPVIVGLAGVHRVLAFAAVIAIWTVAQAGMLKLPAEPWTDRPWFFNPFGWQLVFFTGFAFMSGWLPAPPVDRRLIALAIAFLVLTLPLAHVPTLFRYEMLADWNRAIHLLIDKPDFGILRYAHFLALAYLAWVAVGAGGKRLAPPAGNGTVARVWRTTMAVILKVGQQSLAVFVASMFLARLLGVVLVEGGASLLSMTLVNLLGMALIIGVAYAAAWFKAPPWQAPRATPKGNT